MVNWLRNRFGYRDSAADTVTWHVLAPSSLTSLYPIPIPTRLPACLFQLLGVLAQSACVNGKTFNVSGHVINPNLCSVLCTLSLPFYDLICNLLRGLLRPVFVDLFFSFRLPFSFSCLFFWQLVELMLLFLTTIPEGICCRRRPGNPGEICFAAISIMANS